MRATVDRIEGDIAVLIPREGPPARITLPAALLPAGCREGEIVTVTVTADRRESKEVQDRVSRAVSRLRKR